MTAKVISFINLKGGVGKTTLALAAGEILAGNEWWYEGTDFSLHKKVLMIDLDGQSNLTFAILDEEKIRNCWNNKMSTYHFFSSLLEDPQVSINSCVSERCSNIISTAGCLHVIPSSFDLFNFEEKVMEAYETGRKIDLNFLRRALKWALTEEGLLNMLLLIVRRTYLS